MKGGGADLSLSGIGFGSPCRRTSEYRDFAYNIGAVGDISPLRANGTVGDISPLRAIGLRANGTFPFDL